MPSQTQMHPQATAEDDVRPRGQARLRPANSGRRILREKRTLSAMIDLYCADQHGGSTLCPDCRQLNRYAHQRLDNCVFGESKLSCDDCTAHCYSKTMRARLLEVMGHSQPRLIRHHPILGVLHWIDRLRGGGL